MAPLVLLLPLALAALTALPALLLQEPHPLTVLPGLPLCLAPSYSPVSASSCCQLLLGLLLPAALTLVLVWCLALRRCCNTCQVHTHTATVSKVSTDLCCRPTPAYTASARRRWRSPW